MNQALRLTLRDIAAFLRSEKLPFAVIGGIAVGLRGEPRFTADVDLVIGADVDRALSFLRAVEGSSFVPLFADVSEVVASAFIIPLRHRKTGIKVDLAIGLTGFERQLLERAENLPLGGVQLPVATAEDLLLMKVLADRPRDAEDARRIVDRQGPNLDWAYVLEMGRQLQEAISQDIVAKLRQLQGSPEDPQAP